ncbi:MAG: hypothetical protein ABIX01_12025 [Chitinophagaceae bacterium]
MRLVALLFLLLFSCHNNNSQPPQKLPARPAQNQRQQRIPGQRVIHVFVALCDNRYQGIVPVPEKIGNGQDPVNNLYWGCGYGVKTFFSKSKEWVLQKNVNSKIEKPVLERCVYKSSTTNTWLIADAYDGQFIKACTENFLSGCSGSNYDSVMLKDGTKIFAGGAADLLAYTGHDGLMDFKLNTSFSATDSLKREAVILACISKSYFSPILKQTGAQPVLWSTGLMAPEAYVLHDALSAWIKKEPVENMRTAAAAAYSHYQKCSVKAARNLLVAGW